MTLKEIDRESEQELVSRIKNSDDWRAKEQIFSMYGGILNSLAYRYRSSLLPHGDAYQVAALGLLKALERFEPRKQIAFKSFAYPCIEGELKKFYRDKAEMIRLPPQAAEVETGRDPLRGGLPEIDGLRAQGRSGGRTSRHG